MMEEMVAAGYSVLLMKVNILKKIGVALWFLASIPGAAYAQNAQIDQLFACIEPAISNSDDEGFYKCLGEMDDFYNENIDSALILDEMVQAINSKNRQTIADMAALAPRVNEAIKTEMMPTSKKFIASCTAYQKTVLGEDRRVFARCGFDAAFWVLEYFLDHFPAEFAALQIAKSENGRIQSAYSCVEGVIGSADSEAFSECLGGIVDIYEANENAAMALSAITTVMNARANQIVGELRAYSPEVKEAISSEMVPKGWDFFRSCMSYRAAGTIDKELVVATCSFEVELWTLEYIFSHFATEFAAMR